MTTQNLYALTDLWDAGGTTFTGIGLSVTDTASASGSLLMDLQVGGSSRFKVTKFGEGTFANNLSVGATCNAGTFSMNGDVFLARDAANTLAQRNGTNAQTFRVYNTYTDASNYERGFVGFESNVFVVRGEAAGSGTARNMRIGPNGSGTSIEFRSAGAARWQIDSSGHFIAGADNTYDIGASGANRPRNIYSGSVIVAGTWFETGTGGGYLFTGRGGLASSADGVLKLRNAADSDFSRLQFGGTTSSFPALQRSGNTLLCYLADGSDYAQFDAKVFNASPHIAIPAGGSTAIAYKATATANFGVFFGSGAPTLSAAKGSLYLRSDGTTTNDRMYVNTDGSTTWTAVTTAA